MAEARILAWEGDLDAARTMAVAGLAKQQAEGDTWESAIFGALLGFIELSVPDPPAALRHLRATADYADQVAIVLPTVFRYLGDYVEAAVLAGELDLAERVLVERLEGPAERIPIPWMLAMAARGRGFLSAARGDPDAAIDWFDRSVAVFDSSLPMPFERARAQLARGQALLRAGRRRAAREDIQAATEVFEAAGGAGLGGPGGARSWPASAGAPASRWELTVSERSVADLAAHGHSNREIADRLVLSVRTVESHLGSAYRKLGVRSRGQLVGALAASPGEDAEAGAEPSLSSRSTFGGSTDAGRDGRPPIVASSSPLVEVARVGFYLAERYVPSMSAAEVGAAIDRLDRAVGRTARSATSCPCWSTARTPASRSSRRPTRLRSSGSPSGRGFPLDRIVEATAYPGVRAGRPSPPLSRAR